MEKPRTYMIRCDCSGEVLAIDDWGDDGYLYLQIYHSGDCGVLDKIKAGIKYMLYGNDVFNGMTIGKDKLPGLIDYLKVVTEGKNAKLRIR